MKERNVSEFLLPFMEFVLNRDAISYEVRKENGRVKISTELSARQYKRIRNDALCEVQRGDSEIPVFTYETRSDPKKRERLLDFYGTNGYVPYKKDLERFELYTYC